jgi:hypothetical protein
VLLEHRHRVTPGVEAEAECEVVEAAEKPEGSVPAVVVNDLSDSRLRSEPPAEIRI